MAAVVAVAVVALLLAAEWEAGAHHRRRRRRTPSRPPPGPDFVERLEDTTEDEREREGERERERGRGIEQESEREGERGERRAGDSESESESESVERRRTVAATAAVAAVAALEASGAVVADAWEASGGEVVTTKEFQLKLNAREWSDRRTAVASFLSALGRLTPFGGEEWGESDSERGSDRESEWGEGERESGGVVAGGGVRLQEHFDTAQCGADRSLRMRRYTRGEGAGGATLDVKVVSQHGLRRLLGADFLDVAPALAAAAVQKTEQDVHPCKADKWSREARVLGLAAAAPPLSCAAALRYFPALWPEGEGEGEGEAALPVRRREWWWSRAAAGRLPPPLGLRWRAAFTLKYASEAEACAGATPPAPRGEWSLRVWSDADGLGPWPPAAEAALQAWYEALLLDLGSEGEWPCPPDQ